MAKGGAEILLGILRDPVCIGGSGTLNPHVNDVNTSTQYASKHTCNASIHVHVLTGKAKEDAPRQPCMSCIMYMYVLCIANGIQNVRQRTAANPHARSQMPMHCCFSHRLVKSWYRQEDWSWRRAEFDSTYIADHGLVLPAPLITRIKV